MQWPGILSVPPPPPPKKAGFSISPQSVNTTENSTAAFYCRHRDELRIDWLVNGTIWRQLLSVIATIENYLDAQKRRVVIFNMTAWPITNNSVIQCVADDSIYSEPALLLIQGKKLTSYCITNYSACIRSTSTSDEFNCRDC